MIERGEHDFVNARRHRFLTALLAFALAFSQLAIAAYACPITDGSTLWTDMRHAQSMADCDGMPTQSDAAPNACEAHCLVATQMQGDGTVLAPVAIAPPLVVRTAPLLLAVSNAFVAPDSPLPTPPPLLRFARLLI